MVLNRHTADMKANSSYTLLAPCNALSLPGRGRCVPIDREDLTASCGRFMAAPADNIGQQLSRVNRSSAAN